MGFPKHYLQLKHTLYAQRYKRQNPLTSTSKKYFRVQSSFRVIVTLTPYPDSRGGGLFGQEDNYHTFCPRDSGNSTSPTVKPLKVRDYHKISFHTYTLLTLVTLHINQRHIPRYWKWSPTFKPFPLIMPVQGFNSMPGYMGKPHRIFK